MIFSWPKFYKDNMKNVLIVLLLLVTTGCSVIQEAFDWLKENSPPIVINPPVPTVVPTDVPTVVPTETSVSTPIATANPTKPSSTPTSVPSSENPNVNNQVQYFLDGSGGNLWKPVSDTTGKLVIVFAAKWKKEFSAGCTVQKKDGSFEKLYCGGPFVCYGNPDTVGPRLHMRSNIKCSDAKEVKVVCKEEKQTVVFTVKDQSNLSKVCQRLD